MNTRTINENTNNRVERTWDNPTVIPNIDIYENKEELLLLADLPGVKSEDIQVDVNKGQLSLTARRTLKDPNQQEVQTRDYYRAFTVPSTIDVENIRADLKLGVLHLHLPKSQAAKPRKIEVKSA